MERWRGLGGAITIDKHMGKNNRVYSMEYRKKYSRVLRKMKRERYEAVHEKDKSYYLGDICVSCF
jgi:hypothetical protein